MKKMITLMMLVSSIAALAPQRSEALMFLAHETDILEGPGDVIACIALLPLCLLGEDSAVPSVTPQDLVDNGYSVDEIAEITEGQKMFMEASKTGTFHVDTSIMKNSHALAVELEKQIPGMPKAYLEFVANN